MEMTIKQLADELAVSKSTIGRAIVQLGFQDQLCKIGNKYMLSETQILQIKLQLSKDSSLQFWRREGKDYRTRGREHD